MPKEEDLCIFCRAGSKVPAKDGKTWNCDYCGLCGKQVIDKRQEFAGIENYYNFAAQEKINVYVANYAIEISLIEWKIRPNFGYCTHRTGFNPLITKGCPIAVEILRQNDINIKYGKDVIRYGRDASVPSYLSIYSQGSNINRINFNKDCDILGQHFHSMQVADRNLELIMMDSVVKDSACEKLMFRTKYFYNLFLDYDVMYSIKKNKPRGTISYAYSCDPFNHLILNISPYQLSGATEISFVKNFALRAGFPVDPDSQFQKSATILH